MTPPRYIVPNQLVFVTCGAVGRSFRFLPKRDAVELIWFVLALMTHRSRVQIHEVVFMSNHFHILLTDVDGVLPDFMRDLNSLLSRGLNALRGSTGTNVEKGYNVVAPTDHAKVVDHAVYTLTNPCAADLVERAEHWRGVTTLGLEYGQPASHSRPHGGLWATVTGAVRNAASRLRVRGSEGRARHAGRTKLPKTVDFVLVRPPIRPELSDVELREHIRTEVRHVEERLHVKRRAERRTVVGMKRVVMAKYADTPTTSRVLFDTKPRVSGRGRWARQEELERRLDFEHAHEVARRALAELFETVESVGRDLTKRLLAVEVPKGAFLMSRRYPCLC